MLTKSKSKSKSKFKSPEPNLHKHNQHTSSRLYWKMGGDSIVFVGAVFIGIVFIGTMVFLLMHFKPSSDYFMSKSQSKSQSKSVSKARSNQNASSTSTTNISTTNISSNHSSNAHHLDMDNQHVADAQIAKFQSLQSDSSKHTTADHDQQTATISANSYQTNDQRTEHHPNMDVLSNTPSIVQTQPRPALPDSDPRSVYSNGLSVSYADTSMLERRKQLYGKIDRLLNDKLLKKATVTHTVNHAGSDIDVDDIDMGIDTGIDVEMATIKQEIQQLTDEINTLSEAGYIPEQDAINAIAELNVLISVTD